MPPKMTFIGFYVAKDEGFFKKEGLSVTFAPFNNGIQDLQGVAGGHIDMGATSTSDILAAADKGGHVRAVWGYGVPLDTALITPTSITSVAQLKGKTLGWGGPGSFAQLNFDAAFQAAGIKPTDVNYVTMNRSEYVPAIVAGKIQGAIFHVDDGLNAMSKDSSLHILLQIKDALPTFWYGGLAVTDSWASAHPDVITKTIQALDLADRWMYKHPNQTIAIATKYTKEPQSVVKQTYQIEAKNYEWTVNTGLEQKDVMACINDELKLKWITHNLTFDQVATNQYVNAALKQIGTVNYGY